MRHVKTVTVGDKGYKMPRRSKPWWNEELQILWTEMSKCEKTWLKCKSQSDKSHFKHVYTAKRKTFDKKVQQCKRKFWLKQQTELLNACENSSDFWKKIGKIGVRCNRSQNIPMEVVTENGDVKTDKASVLNKWKTDFENVYNVANDEEIHCDYDPSSNINPHESEILNEGISIIDVKQAVMSLNKNKACGTDGLPAEVLCSDTCIEFLHRLCTQTVLCVLSNRRNAT